jgi:hypothetical protein
MSPGISARKSCTGRKWSCSSIKIEGIGSIMIDSAAVGSDAGSRDFDIDRSTDIGSRTIRWSICHIIGWW